MASRVVDRTERLYSNRLKSIVSVQVKLVYLEDLRAAASSVLSLLLGMRRQRTNGPTGTQRWHAKWVACGLPGEERDIAGPLTVWTAKTLRFVWDRDASGGHGPGNQVIQDVMPGWSEWGLFTEKTVKAECMDFRLWEILQEKVFKVCITDLDELKQRLRT